MTIDRIKIPIMKQDGLEDIDLPAYMSEHASGMDLCAAVGDELIVEPKATLLVPTGIHVAVPAGYEIQIRPRSGLAAKYGIGILNSPGTIDADYRGEIKVILINLGRQDFRVTRGMRIAQMVLQRAQRIEWEAVPSLEPTARSEGGFGHTGI